MTQLNAFDDNHAPSNLWVVPTCGPRGAGDNRTNEFKIVTCLPYMVPLASLYPNASELEGPLTFSVGACNGQIKRLVKLPGPQIPNHRRLGLPASAQHNLLNTHALFKKIQRSTYPKRMATQPTSQV